MADLYNTATTHAEFLVERWDEAAIIAAGNKTINGFLNVAVKDPRSGQASYKIHYPIQSVVPLAAITDGTAREYIQVSASEKTLTISTGNGAPILMTDKGQAGTPQQLMENIFFAAGQTAAKNLDTSLGALYTAAGESVAGTTTTNITEAQIREAKRKLDIANAPREGRWLVVDHLQEDAMTAITDFRNSQTFGNTNAIVNGSIGRVHGFDVFKSHNRTVASGKAYQLAGVTGTGPNSHLESSLVYAFGMPVRSMSGLNERIIDALGMKVIFNNSATLFGDTASISQLYGVAAVRSEWLCSIATAD